MNKNTNTTDTSNATNATNATKSLNTHTRVDLLRHGETTSGSSFRGSIDDALTENGWFQMTAAVEARLAEAPNQWERIVSSPLQRCADFAHKLGKRHSLPVCLDSRFKEMHFGKWEGRTAAELMADDENALTLFWEDPVKNTPPEAEPLPDFERRVLSAWTELLQQYKGEKVLLVTHGGVIRVLLCQFHQWSLHRLMEFDVQHAALKKVSIEHNEKQDVILVESLV
ncbi:MAG: alpha-ribazole phosphatase family protein [Ectothiorhodospiraceae bacterium]|nr:alpha-ribazole phosphatase family protein [Ectothiorhodospiraceae bacterium]MBN4053007.1 alpha-ribazole phosphatase family protein [Gammaproteobacteria bacterium AH-315-K14]